VPVFMVGVCFTFLRGYLFGYAGEKLVKRLRNNLFAAVVSQEIGFFDQNKTGELLNRFSSDTTLIQHATTVTFAMIVRFSMQILGGSFVLLFISWKLCFVMLCPVPLIGVAGYFYSKWMRRVSSVMQDTLANTMDSAEESISGIRHVRAFGKEDTELAKYGSFVEVSFQQGRIMASTLSVLQGGSELSTYIVIILVIWYGVVLMLSGELSEGKLTSFLLYALTVAHAIGAFSNHFGDMLRALGASERVFELIDRESKMCITGGDIPYSVEGTVKFSRVSFSYPSRPEVQVLHELDLVLRPGEVLAMVGSSGSGKSSIAQLILRLYDVDSGVITLDDKDLRTLDPRWLRSQVGFVSQDPMLFSCSIRDNIAYGKPEADDMEVCDAARNANIHDFILSLPNKYDTLCGERGARLSGGQKQRVAIARALLKNPKILIFDEATSALDSESEYAVQVAMERVIKGRTVLIIAHRLSTVSKAKNIVVMEDGRIVEMGTHSELLGREGVYQRLVERQLQNDAPLNVKVINENDDEHEHGHDREHHHDHQHNHHHGDHDHDDIHV